MKKVFIINAHEPYPFSEGRLNRTLADMARAHLSGNGYEVRTVTMQDEINPDQEVDNHIWADAVLIQTPCNWMGVPWSFKRYMDQVYTTGMDGRLCTGDGRSRADLSRQYGSGGTLNNKKYMLSITFNAPANAFNDPTQAFFGAKGIDDLFWPMHLNFKFFGMSPLPSFACYDVLKNPDIEKDFKRFSAHLEAFFPKR